MMDELRGALQMDRFANIKRYFTTARCPDSTLLAHGAAVIFTPVGALPDIIEHERTGLIVKPGDVEGLSSALGRLIEGPDLRRRLAEEDGKALHRMRLDIEACAERLVPIWTESVHAGGH
jgi:glycosyltransferase involved in cell wall biosynthesis